MNNRERNQRIAQETVEILNSGSYHIGKDTVHIQPELQQAVAGTVLYKPDGVPVEEMRKVEAPHPTVLEVTNETTLHAAQRLLQAGAPKVAALNFASARNPGGGFLKGSMAQEESLAMSSGLYACISPLRAMYDHNTKVRTGLYSDYMSYAPDVPVFRNDTRSLLPKPHLCSFISAPAVNAKIVREREPHNRGRIDAVMKQRIEKILTVASLHGHTHLVLGAYGCGVFENRATSVAGYFRELLLQDERFCGRFQQVTFAILDRSPAKDMVRAFQQSLRS
ncbi:hypothetical protein EL26_01130 [Tumebacillus flagellatus]|uniref:Microbial-type PARG catalytic domain-containing protein n=2 Tax=Tumebacillus flagellatus TaxID=1157490 RepID=A0A074LSS1_9BACL|nr:TIGR02452 family protein [Tumebacillus flagellatus]KEO85191.1 hypothetical protein EL26_01130 [Tumebacillus flagellatus]